jgi:hypothetical protein
MRGRDAPYAPLRISMKLPGKEGKIPVTPFRFMRTSVAEELPRILQRMIGGTKWRKIRPRPVRDCHKNVNSL